MMPTVVIAKRPRWDLRSRGCGSSSEMQPMPQLPFMSAMSGSKRVRNGVFVMLWI